MERETRISPGPELELNLASGLLATLSRKDLEAFIRRAEAGFHNFCALPFRGLRNRGAEKLAQNGVSIVHIGDAWNPLSGKLYDHLIPALVTGTYGVFLRKMGIRSDFPIIQDGLFPSRKTSLQIVKELMTAFPGAKFISYKVSLDEIPNDRFLLEIHPGLEMEKEEIADWAQRMGVGLVFDPSHLLEKTVSVSNPGQPTRLRSNWEKEFNFFANTGLLEVVDIHPPDDDYKKIRELRELAAAAKEVVSVKYLRVETRLPIGSQLPVISRGKDFPVLRQIAQTLSGA